MAAKMRRMASKAAMDLATKLRLTDQSRYEKNIRRLERLARSASGREGRGCFPVDAGGQAQRLTLLPKHCQLPEWQ